MADTDNTTILKMAIISIGASLIINLMLIGFAANNSNNYQNDYPYNSIFFQIIEQYEPNEVTCEQGTDCTAAISNVPAQDRNIFNVIQSLLNLGILMVGLLELISMTVLLPLYLNIVLTNYVTNMWIIALGTLFTTIWSYMNIWLIIKLVFK